MGAIVGWFFARIRFDSDDLASAHQDIPRGFAIVFSCAIAAFILGGIAGYIRAYQFPLTEFMGWEREVSGSELQRFTVVGYVHNAGYLGGLIGLVVAIAKTKRVA